MQYLFIFLASILLVGCDSDDLPSTRYADLSVGFENIEDERKFVDLVAGYAEGALWQLDGPRKTPDYSYDFDYVSVITSVNNYRVWVLTANDVSRLVFYCPISDEREERTTEFRRIVRDIVGKYLNEFPDHKIRLQQYRSESYQYLENKGSKLDYLIHNAACK